MQFIGLSGWCCHRLSGDDSFGQAAFGNSLQSSLSDERVILGIADEVGRDLRWSPIEWVRADENPRMAKRRAERFVEPAFHDSATSSGDGNEWGQDSLKHDAGCKFVVTGAGNDLSKTPVALGVIGVVTETAAVENLIELSQRITGEAPLIYMAKHARLGGQCGPFGNELLDQGRLTRWVAD